jgi:hypothetical protein
MGRQRQDVAPAAVSMELRRCVDPQEPGVARRSLKLRPEQEADLRGQAEIGDGIPLAMPLKQATMPWRWLQIGISCPGANMESFRGD